MSGNNATVKILRYDPAAGRGPYLQTYQVPPPGWAKKKVVDTLQYIQENLDPTLAFREPCRQGTCGACTVTLNGRPVPACEAVSEKEMVIGPAPEYPVIKDLVVDRSAPRG